MTERLYYTDAYRTAFDARVVARDDGGRRVRLDRTAFYPTSGGQPHDLGTLGGAPVVDVIDEGDAVVHLLAAPPAEDGEGRVTGEIDWARRFDHMRQHTGQHLLSAVVEDLFGWTTVSVHFGPESSTVDLDVELERVGRDRLVEAELRANALVAEARPVAVSFEEAETALGLRKPSGRTGTIRVVTIDGVDRSACGGTHVRSTAEIGPVLLRRVEKVRRTTRVELLCGDRAIRRARADYEALAATAQALTASVDAVPALVAARLDAAKEADSARRRLEAELVRYRLRELLDAVAPDAAGVRRLLVDRPAGGADELRALAQAVAGLPAGERVVLAGAVDEPALVVLASSQDSGVDAGAAIRPVLAELGGRGGGSPRIAQGTLADAARVREAIARLR
jgi:alanyl-tRNA synthetase